LLSALNIAYEEKEERGFFRQLMLSMTVTAGAVLVVLLAILVFAVIDRLELVFGHLPKSLVYCGTLLSYLVLLLVAAAGAGLLYRYGPDRRNARWTWITPGSVLTAGLWLLVTLGFGFYVSNLGHYNATYGSLGAVLVFLTWLYLSAFIFLVGAELNSEIEKRAGLRFTAPNQAGVIEAERTVQPPSPSGETVKLRPAQPSLVKDVTVIAGVSKVAPIAGLPHVGWAPAALSAMGLAALRQKGRAPLGIVLFCLGGGMAWAGRTSSSSEEAMPDS
jgi:membrane protein